MPKPEKGTKCIKIQLSKASKCMQTPLVPVFFPVLGARDCVAKFQYLTSFGGGYAAKWHASWPILGVTNSNSLRVNVRD
jgi:hypothetical protein